MRRGIPDGTGVNKVDRRVVLFPAALVLIISSCISSGARKKNSSLPFAGYSPKAVKITVVQVIKTFDHLERRFISMVSAHFPVAPPGSLHDAEIILFVHPVRYVSVKREGGKGIGKCNGREIRFSINFTIQTKARGRVVYERDGESLYAAHTCTGVRELLKGEIKKKLVENLLSHRYIRSIFPAGSSRVQQLYLFLNLSTTPVSLLSSRL